MPSRLLTVVAFLFYKLSNNAEHKTHITYSLLCFITNNRY